MKRNRRTGRITSAQFRPLPQNSAALEGNETLRKTAHLGQHYSYRELVDEHGHRVWSYVNLLVPGDCRSNRQAIEAYLQKVFRAVQLSCLAHR